MATTNGFSGRLGKLLLAQNDVLSRAQALDGGMTEAALRHRLRPGGAWRIVLPGIYLATAGLPTVGQREMAALLDRKSTRLNSSHTVISYAVFCLKKKKQTRRLAATCTMLAAPPQPPTAMPARQPGCEPFPTPRTWSTTRRTSSPSTNSTASSMCA